MGLDVYSQLYYGLDFDEVYKYKRDITVYDLYDQRTGEKTGKQGQDVKDSWINTITGETFVCNRSDLPSEEDTHSLDQERLKRIIGIEIKTVGGRSGPHHGWISDEDIQAAKDEFDKQIRPLFGMNTVYPKILINTYYSY